MKQPDHATEAVGTRLERAATELPAERDDAVVSRVMHAVRTRAHPSATPRPASIPRPAWLAAAATALVAVIVVAVSTTDFQPKPPAGAEPLPVRMGQDLDPLLARSENDLAQEMQSIRADLNHLSRMMTVRLESDSE